MEWEKSEREAGEEFKGLIDLFKGKQSPKRTHSTLKFSEHVETGGGPKDIKIPQVVRGRRHTVEAYFYRT